MTFDQARRAAIASEALDEGLTGTHGNQGALCLLKLFFSLSLSIRMLELSGLANHSIYPGSTALEAGDTGRTYGGKHINSSETLAFFNTHTEHG